MPSIRLTLLCLFSAVSAAGCALFSDAPQGPVTPLSPEEAAFGNLGRPAFTLTGSGTQTFVCTRDKKGRYWRLEHSDVKLSLPGASRVLVLVRQKTDFTFVSSDGSMLSARVFKWVSGASHGRSQVDSFPDPLARPSRTAHRHHPSAARRSTGRPAPDPVLGIPDRPGKDDRLHRPLPLLPALVAPGRKQQKFKALTSERGGKNPES